MRKEKDRKEKRKKRKEKKKRRKEKKTKRYLRLGMLINEVLLKQGRIHGNPVADGWAGAVLQKTFGIQKCDGRTD